MRTTHLKSIALGMVVAGSLLLHGCGWLVVFNEAEMARRERERHQAQFQPYKDQHTIAAYREFLSRYPENMYAGSACKAIVDLEFAPYEQENSVEGYMEFKMLYPYNPHGAQADNRIEQVEIKRYQRIDTIEGFREFLEKYPDSIFAISARQRLQDLELAALDRTMKKQYGFDVLLYKLQLHRIHKNTPPGSGAPEQAFTMFASLDEREGKTYFRTHLLYARSALENSASLQTFLQAFLAEALEYLGRTFSTKRRIDGYVFDIATSPDLFYGNRQTILEYSFPAVAAQGYARQAMNAEELLAQAVIAEPGGPDTPARAEAARREATSARGAVAHRPQDAQGIMQMAGRPAALQDMVTSRTWELWKGGERIDQVQTVEKWKRFGGQSGCVDKSIIRYLDQGSTYGQAPSAMGILTVNHTNNRREHWVVLHRGDAGRHADIARYRHRAQTDFNLTEYVDIAPDDERHRLRPSEDLDGMPCIVVESTPVRKDAVYGKRISWVDQSSFVPLRVEYYSGRGDLWKCLSITWQQRYGHWLWEQAVVENVMTGYRTVIGTGDVRINVGLPESDFTRFALEKLSKR